MQKKINVLLVRPFSAPEEIEIENTYEKLKELVEGYLEMPYYFDDVDVICNEEGKLIGLDANRIMTMNGEPFDIIMGNIVVAGHTPSGNTKGLTPKQIEKYKEVFSRLYVEIGVK